MNTDIAFIISAILVILIAYKTDIIRKKLKILISEISESDRGTYARYGDEKLTTSFSSERFIILVAISLGEFQYDFNQTSLKQSVSKIMYLNMIRLVTYLILFLFLSIV